MSKKETKPKFTAQEIVRLLSLNNRDIFIINKKYNKFVGTKDEWEELLK